MAVYELPELPYDYDALEPHYSRRVLELHHDKHHATYVKGANDALDQFEAFRSDGADNQQLLARPGALARVQRVGAPPPLRVLAQHAARRGRRARGRARRPRSKRRSARSTT